MATRREASDLARRAPHAGGGDALPTCTIAGTLLADGKPAAGQLALRAYDGDHLFETAEASADGRFTFGARPASAYTITASALGHASMSRAIDCTTPRIGELELIVPACERTTRGTIHDANGTALAEATVTSGGLVIARSDASGAFSVCLARSVEELVFHADGYAPTGRTGHGLADLAIVLVPEATLAVKVVDEAGHFVAGAVVTAKVQDQPFSFMDDPFRASMWLQPGRGVTGADGTVELEQRPIELHAVTARLGDRASETVEVELISTERRELTLTLHEPAWVRGTVLVNGAPAAGVIAEWNLGSPRAVTGADGTFALPLPPGTAGGVFLQKPWFIVGERAAAIAGQTPPLTIAASRQHALRGSARFRGAPVGGARVVSDYDQTITRTDGSFEVLGPRFDAQVGIAVYADELGARGTLKVPFTHGADIDGLIVELAPTGTISGTLVDEHGAPIAGAVISTRDATTSTDETGAFTLSQLPSETYRLRASLGDADLTLVKGERAITVAAGQRVRGHVLVARLALGTIAGVVVDSRGAPVPSAWVYSSSRYRDTHTDDDGRFRLAVPIDDADAAVTVYAQGAIGQQVRMDASPGQDVKLQLPDPGRLRISCTGAGTRTRIVVERAGGAGSRSARCGQTVGALPPGAYTVRGFEAQVPAQVEAGATTDVSLEISASSHR